MLILIYLKKKNSLAIFVYLLIPFFADDRIGKLSNSENKHADNYNYAPFN